jgi:hypothetical protein
MFAWVAMEILCLGGGWERMYLGREGGWKVHEGMVGRCSRAFCSTMGDFGDFATEWGSILYFCSR